MKFNWKLIKVIGACVLMVGVIFWAVDSLRTRSYSGTDLNFSIGSGPVTVTNSSGEPVAVQLISHDSRAFEIGSTSEGLLPGVSTREGTGRTATQFYDVSVPTGVSEFILKRGTNVAFVSNTGTSLSAAVQPTSSGQSSAVLIGAAVVMLGLLFYISSTNGHTWIKGLLGRVTPPPVLVPVPEVQVGSQGRAIRSYGDNRAEKSD